MQLVRRTLAVLTELGRAPDGLGLQDLAIALEMPISSLHRLLTTMTDAEFVFRSPDRRFLLGPAALALAQGARQLEVVARPHMKKLAAETSELVFLTRLVGSRAVCVELVEGDRPLRLYVAVGQVVPFHAAASARVLLSRLPESQVDELLADHEFDVFAPGTPRTAGQVKELLTAIRVRGYDICRNELDPGVLAASAPIVDNSGQVLASLTVASPADRTDDQINRTWRPALFEAVDRIQAELGLATTNGSGRTAG